MVVSTVANISQKRARAVFQRGNSRDGPNSRSELPAVDFLKYALLCT